MQHVEVQAGQQIEILVREGKNLAEDIWGLDAREFKPERWLSDGGLTETVANIHAQGNILIFGDRYNILYLITSQLDGYLTA